MGDHPGRGELNFEDAHRRSGGQHALNAPSADPLAEIVDQMQLAWGCGAQKPSARIAKKRRHVVRQPQKASRLLLSQLSLQLLTILRRQKGAVRAACNPQYQRERGGLKTHQLALAVSLGEEDDS